MRIFELVVAAVFALLGLRSLITWLRRPLDSPSLRDHVLFALWVTGRVGLWLAIGGIFLISALIDVQGRAFVDEWSRYRWYIMVPIGLAALQLLAGTALGRTRD